MTQEPEPKRGGNARFKLLVHEDPENDQLVLYVDFNSVHIRMIWRDSERQDVEDLIAQGTWFLERGHLEHEVNKNASQIDADLGQLFPEEEVEDGE